MIKKHFESVPEFGIERWWHYDESSDTAVIETVQDHTAIVEANKASFNSVDERSRYNDGMHKVATIPLVILQDLKQKGILNDPAALKRWLNDPENRYFRTRPGQV
ncbi:hypothetical protein [Paraburkholderia terrae]|uniref:hypothetical protein n=1 Tax=Paraburkholderia terrae TaxID=311230 RepID=UPI00206C883C|nr:hypothetical protein [Paraburkholderia terrae]BDC37915.1 hypothetical protein PTKU15_12120 [Paraburkholderia terrae]